MEFYGRRSHEGRKISLDMQNIKVVVTDTHYYYNKNNVTCKADFTVRLPKALEDLIGWIDGDCTATAFCSPKDAYDQRTGEKIALAKAESRIYEGVVGELNGRIDRIRNVIETTAPVVTKFNLKAVNAITHNDGYIDRIS